MTDTNEIRWSPDHTFIPSFDPELCGYCYQRSADHNAGTLACDEAAIARMDNQPMYFVADRPDGDEGPGMAPVDVAFAILDGWANSRGFVDPTADDAAVAAAAACAYELRELRRMMSPPEFVGIVQTTIGVDGPPRHGVIKIGD